MKTWLKDTFERALSSAAGAALTVLGLDALNVMTADWALAGSMAAGAAVLSVLKALAARKVGNPNSASLVD